MIQEPLVYIAGHRGMVGSALVRMLQSRGFRNVLLRTRQELDLSDSNEVNKLFERFRPQWVFIAAAKVGGIVANNSYPANFIRENLQIQLNLIEAARRFQASRVLFLGSSCIYPRLAVQPLTESSLLSGPLEPTNRAYALAKIAGIEMCWSYNRQYGTVTSPGYLAAMPTNLYGTGDNYHPTESHVIPGLIRRFHEAKLSALPEVVVWGSGKPRREFMHADDMAAACVRLISLPEDRWQKLLASDRNDGEAPLVNIGVGHDLTIKEVAKTVSEIVGYRGAIRFDTSKPDGTPRKLMSSAKLDSLFPDRPQRTLRDGLTQTYAEFRELYKLEAAALPDC